MSRRLAKTIPIPQFPTGKRRAGMIVLAIAVLLFIVSSSDLHDFITGIMAPAGALIQARPVLGMVVFVLLAAASAMLAFLSSAVLTPVAVLVWGKTVSMLLLWLGWTLGGMSAYGLSRYLGRPVVARLISMPLLERYERFIPRRAPFGLILLFQFAVPSELPGYVLGLARYRFRNYLAALALAELPYAVATVYLGAGFLERQTFLLVTLGASVAALSGFALYTLHHKLTAARQATSRPSTAQPLAGSNSVDALDQLTTDK